MQIVRCLVAVVENPGPALDGFVGEALLKERDRVARLQMRGEVECSDGRGGVEEVNRGHERTLPTLAEGQKSTEVQTGTAAFPW